MSEELKVMKSNSNKTLFSVADEYESNHRKKKKKTITSDISKEEEYLIPKGIAEDAYVMGTDSEGNDRTYLLIELLEEF